MSVSWREMWERQPLRWSALLVVVVALASSVSGLGNGFAFDDLPIIVENPMVNQLQSLGDYLTTSYWGPSRGNSLYRPVTVIAYALEWKLGAGDPWPFHAANVTLYALTALAVLGLARTLLPAAAALVAALVWAAHPVHVEAVANGVGQAEMLAALPMLLAVTAFVRDRRMGTLRPVTIAAIGALFAVALLSKEHGIVLPALLVLAEFVLRAHGGAGRSGEVRARLWLLGRVLAMTAMVYLVMRFTVLNGFAGDYPNPSLVGLSLVERSWVMLGLLPEFVRLFFWPVRLYADYSPQAIPVLTSASPRHVLGVAWLACYAWLLVWGWRRDRVVAFALLWLAITLGPVSNILVPTGVLVAERTLFLPSVGIALFLGWGVAWVWPRLLAVPARWVRVAVPTTGGVVLFAATAASAARQPVWADNQTLFATTVVDAPNNFRAQHGLGEMFGAAAAWSRALVHLRTADSLYPGYELLQLSLARALHFDDRCPAALPLYTEVLRKRPDAEIAAVGRTACLLEMRQLSAARAEAIGGIARGVAVSPYGILLQKAESSLVATDTVDARNRWWRAGAPFSRSNARLRVPVLMMKGGGIDPSSRGKMPEFWLDSAKARLQSRR